MEQWIEEVLFRGRPPSGQSSDMPPRLHVVIGLQADDPFSPGEKSRRTVGPMSMTQAAEKFGYTPKSLVSEINTALDQARQNAETAQRAAEERAKIAEARLQTALDELEKRG